MCSTFFVHACEDGSRFGYGSGRAENAALLGGVGRHCALHLRGAAGRLDYERLDEKGKRNDRLLFGRDKAGYF